MGRRQLPVRSDTARSRRIVSLANSLNEFGQGGFCVHADMFSRGAVTNFPALEFENASQKLTVSRVQRWALPASGPFLRSNCSVRLA
jgi:hypothetical protein